ncbi:MULTISPECIES: hypothetical protein [Nostocaceae]|uniref:hypothetical protein n=1 Tax=Nostocaceae TaxID=1162 RepID=UPI0016885A58|nr:MULTISPECIES: hypothetical protein [Nostocaceae]MBD2301809.1 hypothetical protein [Nostoc sp. FACHB-190]MBD2479045.1 hypothetical protein [Anabaena sp. FACHB-83]
MLILPKHTTDSPRLEYSIYKVKTQYLAQQGKSKKAKVKGNNNDTTSLLAIPDSRFIYADLY